VDFLKPSLKQQNSVYLLTKYRWKKWLPPRVWTPHQPQVVVVLTLRLAGDNW